MYNLGQNCWDIASSLLFYFISLIVVPPPPLQTMLKATEKIAESKSNIVWGRGGKAEGFDSLFTDI